MLEAFVRVSGPLVQAQHRAYVRDTELYWKIHGDRTMTPERAARLVLAHDAGGAPDLGEPPASDEDRLN